MCGRFTIQYTWAEFYDALHLIPEEASGRNDPPRYNVAPTQDVGFVYTEDGYASRTRWPLVAGAILGEGSSKIRNVQCPV